MSYTFSRMVKIGKKLKTKRTPWKPRDLRDINLYSKASYVNDLRKADLMRHSRYSENGTEIVEVRDKQSDPSDIIIYQINQQTGGSSNNFYDGSNGNDVLEGGAGDDFFQGMDGDDILTGYAGNDFLDGGEGSDTLIGGDGQDYFRISVETSETSPVRRAAFDRIIDFKKDEEDKIVINLTLSQPSPGNSSSLDTVQISSSSEETDRLFSQGAILAYEMSTGKLLASSLLFGDSSAKPILLATLNGNPTATINDFITITQ